MVAAILLAAGHSSRFQHSNPKLFVKFGSKTLIEIIIDKFLDIKAIDQITLVNNNSKYFDDIKVKYKDKLLFIKGGEERQDSVRMALNTIDETKYSKILIHDAARYNCSKELILSVLQQLDNHQAVIPILPMIDTVKILDTHKKLINSTLDRSKLGLAQTPQGFNLKLIKDLHNNDKFNIATDDASLCEENGIDVTYIKGEKSNFKITEIEDYNIALKALPSPKYIHTNGYDLHRFETEEQKCHIKLGGIDIAHNRKLIAHSDGDVLLHSITDAVLGLTASSDIGELFPDDKKENENRNSIDFINKAIEIAQNNKIIISHIDITIILEAPKLSPYKDKIRNNIAKIFHLNNNQVNIKATTNEKIGDIGNGDAIAVLTTITGEQYEY
ncbi:MAG: 2-C-methyl-D-erythritol 4-phosphate cytidylyltransferase [Rickettsiales bacterium]|jgi:2-C-methyl-D-erythritol 4-phosphate cytidylyltransferase / 2-C-methyl-D-erythritol 2,4-cyclodiphosphate synthase|nr:2-C-methyl-D-erythritol 4-phosphate cytidylyltransferase [Rickettsiales bacterium]